MTLKFTTKHGNFISVIKFVIFRSGQERRETPYYTHISSTIEMIDITKEYDVVVIDEIQMIGDEDRGYAWTKMLLGLDAKEIHLCGGNEAKEVVEKMMEITKDDYEYKEYFRFTPLKVTPSLVGDYGRLQEGDCIVCFSVNDIFEIKREVEHNLPYFKCCIIYGSLPPNIRSEQAQKFNDPTDKQHKILISTDAIGMGLNLNIQRIVFHSILKYGKKATLSFIHPSLVKQIGGRAGRRGSRWENGFVTTWQDGDLWYVDACLSRNIDNITKIGYFPSMEQITYFYDKFQHRWKFMEDFVKNNKSLSVYSINEDEMEDEMEESEHAMRVLDEEEEEMNNRNVVTIDEESKETEFTFGEILRKFCYFLRLDENYFLCSEEDMRNVSSFYSI